MLHYILQTIAFQLFFLIIYDAFLRRETFFNWNRAYLLVTTALSVVLPFIRIQSFKDVVPNEYIATLPEVIIGKLSQPEANIALETVVDETSKFQFSWTYVFYIGAAVAFSIFVVKLVKIILLVYKNPKEWKGQFRIVTLLKSNVAFSFFYYIFLGERIKKEDKPIILKHEAVHVNQKHTLDLLFFELLRIVFWFNPLIYMYQVRIASLHEFIADAEAVKSKNKNQYYQDLLSQIFETQNVSFINAFYKKSLIKKRIVMLSKVKSKQINLVKYALLVPMVFGMLLYTSSYAQDGQISENLQNTETTQELTDQELKDKYYVEMLDLYNTGNTAEIFKDSENIRNRYLNTREEYYRFQANMKVMFDKMGHTYTGDQKALKEKLNRSYADYLEFKKTDEAKEIWENNTSDGILRIVVNKLGDLSEEEKKEQEKKIQLMMNDDFFHKLIVTDGAASSTMMAEPMKEPTEQSNETVNVIETQSLDPIEVPFAKIDEPPMLPSCENKGTQDERRDCVASEISEHIKKNFNQTLAWNLGLTGKQRITVVFKIDTNGNVFGVRSRAPHPDLEAEVIRVINTLPQFTPGKQNGEKVIVPYSLPIIFEVRESPNSIISYVQTTNSPSKEISEKQDMPNLTEVPFAVIDEAPTSPSCKDLANNDERKSCIANQISKHVQKNFNVKLAEKLGLVGRQRINVIFKIDVNGNVIGIRSRAPHPDLETEAIRVIKTLPQFIPGKHKGEPVIVPYSLPIVFEVKADVDKSSEGSGISLGAFNVPRGSVKVTFGDRVLVEGEDYTVNYQIGRVQILDPKIQASNTPIQVSVKNNANKIEHLTEVPFAVIEQVPTFPGCETLTNQKELRKCMSDKISTFVQKKFNTNIASEEGLTGRQRISVVFKIDTTGNITGIRSRAASPKLEDEAARVIGLLPKMNPGKHDGKHVIVPYSLPIIFQVGTSKSLANKEKSTDLMPFKIIVETTDNEIQLKCESGCAWKELTFASNDMNKIQAINQLGMTQLNKDNISNDSDLANFLITLEKTEKGIKLKGIKGSSWTDLSFSLPIGKKQIINELGMINE